MTEYLTPSMLLLRLRREGHRATKRLGQHFLTDEHLLEKIADLTQANAQTLIVEIGPGPATLTTCLARRAGRVIAIERDERMRSFHAQNFPAGSNVEFMYADALRVDLWKLVEEEKQKSAAGTQLPPYGRCVLAGNIPFQITSPLLFGQIGEGQPWSRMVLMIQREVANRIMAKPHTKDYGILTVKLAYWWRVVERIEIPAAMFSPRPKVDATTLAFEPLSPDADFRGIWPDLSKFIDLCFNQRRKKLYNSPAAMAFGGRDKLRTALEALSLNADLRPEDLSPEEFLNLFRTLHAPVR